VFLDDLEAMQNEHRLRREAQKRAWEGRDYPGKKEGLEPPYVDPVVYKPYPDPKDRAALLESALICFTLMDKSSSFLIRFWVLPRPLRRRPAASSSSASSLVELFTILFLCSLFFTSSTNINISNKIIGRFVCEMICAASRSQTPIERVEERAESMWDQFYRRHEAKFFKDRHWLLREFHELLPKEKGGLGFSEVQHSLAPSSNSPLR